MKPQFTLRTLLVLLAALALLLAQYPYFETIEHRVQVSSNFSPFPATMHGPAEDVTRPTFRFALAIAFEAGALLMWLVCKWSSYRATRQSSGRPVVH